MELLELADRLWSGETATSDRHPFSFFGEAAQVQPGLLFLASFANVTALQTAEGLVLIDTGSKPLAQTNHDLVRNWSQDPLHTAIYTHGHIDHVFGLAPYELAGSTPHVIAHERVPARFDRYLLTAGYNQVINQRQFRMPNLRWPLDYRYPDQTYQHSLETTVGGERLEITHALGETDDHSWVHIPSRSLICCGDLFIWVSPNCGNPQKVQRYPREWAQALRQMASKNATTLLPGHGLPIIGADRVRQALTDSAELLESLVEQTLALMNGGARLDEILHTVKAPEALLQKPYLRPLYDEPEFIVRNLWRLYGGWYDGNPAHLKPAPDRAIAEEVAALAGGAAKLVERAQGLAEAGDLRLACHLAEWAALAAPSDEGIQRARRLVYATRAEAEASTMSKGVFGEAAEPIQ